MNGRKKLVVILILLALIAVITLAGSSLFGNVTVEFRSENTMQYTYSQLLSYSGIPNDANILKLDTELIKANIESNCNYLVEVKNI